MEELRLRLEQIKQDMQELDAVSAIAKRQSSILDCLDRVNKEVV